MTLIRKANQTFSNARGVLATFAMAALLGGSVPVQAAPDDGAAGSTIAQADGKAEQAVSDSWITTKVKSEILANSVSKGFQVSVTTKQGVVALEGKLPNKEAIDLVKLIAEKVKGVHSVDTSGLVVGG